MRDSIIIIQQEKEDKDCYIFRYVLCYVLGCILMLSLFLCEHAKADEMDPTLQEYVYEYFDTYLKNYPQELVAQAVSECQYFACYSVTDNRGWTYYFIDFYNEKNIGLAFSDYDSSSVNFGSRFSYWGSSVIPELNYVSYYNGIRTPFYKEVNHSIVTYRFTSGPNNNVTYLGAYRFMSTETSSYWYSVNQYSGYFFRGLYGSPNLTQYGSDYYNPFSKFNYISSYGDVYLQINKTTWQSFEDTITPPTQTEGLKVYKQSIHNQEFLMIDFSDCIDWHLVPTGTDIYISDASFNLNIDGTTELYELDEQYYFTTNRDKEKAYWQIPETNP